MKATELLELFVKAHTLRLGVEVRKDNEGDYVIKLFEQFTNNFCETVVVTAKGESNWGKGDYEFTTMVDILDEELKKREKERVKGERRRELIARLSEEERELLGVQ